MAFVNNTCVCSQLWLNDAKHWNLKPLASNFVGVTSAMTTIGTCTNEMFSGPATNVRTKLPITSCFIPADVKTQIRNLYERQMIVLSRLTNMGQLCLRYAGAEVQRDDLPGAIPHLPGVCCLTCRLDLNGNGHVRNVDPAKAAKVECCCE